MERKIRINPSRISYVLTASALFFIIFLFPAAIHADEHIDISYNNTTNTISIEQQSGELGERITLADIKSSLVQTDLIVVDSGGVWYVRANILLIGKEDAPERLQLELTGGLANEIRLQSDNEGFVWIRAENADISITDTLITSWNESDNGPDTSFSDGRSYLLAKYDSRMDIRDSDIGYLGYFAGESYGVSWRVPLHQKSQYTVTGEIENSDFHHNYYGVYTHSAEGMVFRNNRFFENILYGFDPHDDSNNFLVENNEAFRNGTHGFIFSKRCENNVIRNNVAYENGSSGFMLDKASNNNRVEGNESYSNRDGFALYGSANNIVADNNFHHNGFGIVAKDESFDNVIENNVITQNERHGIKLYNGAGKNEFRQNTIAENGNFGIYIKTPENIVRENNVLKNFVGIYLAEAHENSINNNLFEENERDGVLLKFSDNNHIEGNIIDVTGNKGIILRDSNENTIDDNEVFRSGDDGIYVYSNSSGNTITTNLVESNGDKGIYLKGANGNIVSDNTAKDNASYGIYANSSVGNSFSGDSMIGNIRDYYYGKHDAENEIHLGNSDVTVKTGESQSVWHVLDAQSRIFDSNRALVTTFSPRGTAATVDYEDNVTRVSPTSLRVIPADGEGTARLIEWHNNAEGTKTWIMTSEEVEVRVDSLYNDTPYAVYKDGVLFLEKNTTSDGVLSFVFDGNGSEAAFEIKNSQ